MTDIRLLYITCSSNEEATKLSTLLLDARLVACTNTLTGATSRYRWNEKIEESQEHILIAKTMDIHSQEAISLIKEHHSYDCPCILELPAAGGNQDFIEWIRQEVK